LIVDQEKAHRLHGSQMAHTARKCPNGGTFSPLTIDLAVEAECSLPVFF
jgi:hypothetical protein